jgi:hypothetical protein
MALDSRGRGRSDHDRKPANYSFTVEVAHLVSVLTALEIDRAVFIGTSRGGILAMLLAPLRPRAIAGVVLNDIGPGARSPGADPHQGGWRANCRPRAPSRRGPTSCRGSARPSSRPCDWLRQARAHVEEIVEALARVPLMVMRGGNSDILSRATLEALDFVEIPDQGHAPLLAEPEIIRRIAGFIALCECGIARTPRGRAHAPHFLPSQRRVVSLPGCLYDGVMCLAGCCLPGGRVAAILVGLPGRVGATEYHLDPRITWNVRGGRRRVWAKIDEAANRAETRPGRTRRPVMEKVAVAAVMIALLIAPAYSQSMQQRQQERGTNVTKTPMQIQEEERAQRALQADRDYEAAMKRSKATTPSAAPASDPWQNVRPSPSPNKKAN